MHDDDKIWPVEEMLAYEEFTDRGGAVTRIRGVDQEYPAHDRAQHSPDRAAPYGENRAAGPAGQHRIFQVRIPGRTVLFQNGTGKEDLACIFIGICDHIFPTVYRLLSSRPGIVPEYPCRIDTLIDLSIGTQVSETGAEIYSGVFETL